jgi:hypothetical protein
LIKKLFVSFLIFAVFVISSLLANEKQLRVTAERATIYAEAHTESYRIEIVKKGTILTVFASGESSTSWYYVSYSSERWKSRVTGFIQASMVEEVTEKPKEKIPEKKETVLEREQWPEEAKPKIEKPQAAPAKEKPVVQQVTVTESVGVSSVLPSKSYALPKSDWDEDSRPYLSIDSIQESVETIKKQEKSIEDITEKIPDKLEAQKPPEKIKTEPEPEEKKEVIKKEDKPEEQAVPQVAPKKPRLPGMLSHFTLGMGYGPSVGSGLGGFIQINSKTGFSIHLGVGYYPTTYFYSEHEWVKNQVLYSAGIKYYIPLKSSRLRPYLDLQYGGVSVEAVSIITGLWNYQFTYENIQKSLYGPSLLAGIELRWGSLGINGAIGLSYNMTEWEYWERDYFLTADVGLLIYFW